MIASNHCQCQMCNPDCSTPAGAEYTVSYNSGPCGTACCYADANIIIVACEDSFTRAYEEAAAALADILADIPEKTAEEPRPRPKRRTGVVHRSERRGPAPVVKPLAVRKTRTRHLCQRFKESS